MKKDQIKKSLTEQSEQKNRLVVDGLNSPTLQVRGRDLADSVTHCVVHPMLASLPPLALRKDIAAWSTEQRRRSQNKYQSLAMESNPLAAVVQWLALSAGLWLATGAEAALTQSEGVTDAALSIDALTPKHNGLGGGLAAPQPASKYQLKVFTNKASLPADGKSAFVIDIKIRDESGALIKGESLVWVKAGGARVRLPANAPTEINQLYEYENMREEGLQVLVRDGVAKVEVVAPTTPQTVVVRIAGAGMQRELTLEAMPHKPEAGVSVGVIEGIIQFNRTGSGRQPDTLFSGVGDGFDQAIERWSRWNSDKTVGTAARAAFYIKGSIKGDTLLTMSYDSDKDIRRKVQSEIDPEQWYPVYGDASTKHTDNPSSDRFYVRLDRNKSFILYGDLETAGTFSPRAGTGYVNTLEKRELGNYSRSLTGVKAHYQLKGGHLDLFAARDNTKQSVQEFPARSLSGPYPVTGIEKAVAYSEKVEIITRSRHNLADILKVKTLNRGVDYVLDGTTSRLYFKDPIEAFDSQFNPVYIRVTYEVQLGEAKHWTYGLDASYNLSEKMQVGAAYAKDRSESAPYELRSAYVEYSPRKNLSLLGEVAHSQSRASARNSVSASTTGINLLQDTTGGLAWRVAAQYAGERVQVKARSAKSEFDFYNPSSSMSGGRREHGFDLAYQDSSRSEFYLRGNANYDLASSAKERRWVMGVNYKLADQWLLSVGYTGARRTTGMYTVQNTPATTNSSITAGTDSSKMWGSALAGQTYDYNAAVLGLRYQPSTTTTVDAEYSADFGSDKQYGLFKLGVQTQYESKGLGALLKPYVRYEGIHGLKSIDQHAANINKDKANALVMGAEIVPQTDIEGFQISAFTENRLRNNAAGIEKQWVNGVKTNWQLQDNLTVSAGLEHLHIHQGTAQAISSVYGGANWQLDKNRVFAAQLELRREHGYEQYVNGGVTTPSIPKKDFVLARIQYAHKVGEEWTVLMRNTGSLSKEVKSKNKGYDNHMQFGLAYRSDETNKINALAKYSWRTTRNTNNTSTTSASSTAATSSSVTEGYDKHIFSLHADYRPERALTLSGRLAYKRQTDYFIGRSDEWAASLASLRVFYELNDKWSVAAHAHGLKGLSASDRGLYKNLGAEVGYNIAKNTLVSAGYNFNGFDAPDMTGNNYTSKGPYLRLRYTLPDLFGGE